MRPTEVTCTCHPIGLNDRDYQSHITTVAWMARDQIVGYDWQPDCPEHGLKSEWYLVEGGKQHLDAQSAEAVRLQRLARKAREAGRGVCRYCEHFIDECICPSIYGTCVTVKSMNHEPT